MIGGLLGEGSFLWEQTQLLLWAAAGTCSGGQDGALLVLWVPVPGSSHVLGAAPARWQEEFQALQCSMFSPCSCCCRGGLFQEVLIHQIYSAASRVSCGDVSVGKSLEALILILHFQAFGLKNAVKTGIPHRKRASFPSQCSWVSQAVHSAFGRALQNSLFVFVPGEARAGLSGLFCGGCQFCT